MATKRDKRKQFIASCAFKETGFHYNLSKPSAGGVKLGLDFQEDVSGGKLFLYYKLPRHVKQTITKLNLHLPSLKSRKNKVKICQHCVSKLDNISNFSDTEMSIRLPDIGTSSDVTCTGSLIDHRPSSAILADHSYASSTSSSSDSEMEGRPLETESERNFSESESDDTSLIPEPLLSSTPQPKQKKYGKKQKVNTSIPSDLLTSSSQQLNSPTNKASGDNIIEQLKTLPQSELSKVAHYLGTSQAADVRKDCISLNQTFDDLDYLTHLNVDEWLSKRNPVVLSFIKGVSGRTSPMETKPLYSIVKGVEQIYSTQPTRHVLPLSFAENIVAHSVVNSKLAANLNGLSSPSGSYWTLKNWLENQACHPLPQPVGDCICAFDNDQVIGKTYHVRANSKLKTSVVTSVCMAEVDITGSLQKKSYLKPIHWKNDIAYDQNNILDYHSAHHNYLSDVHFKEVFNSLQAHIAKVQSEQSENENGLLSDDVDKAVSEKQFAREWRVCSFCHTHNAKAKRLCENCRQPLRIKTVEQVSDTQTKEQETAGNPPKNVSRKTVEVNFPNQPNVLPTTSFVGNMHNETAHDDQHIRVTARDPVFVNPNSFETVKEVFLHIGKDFHIRKYVDKDSEASGNEREWLLVVCDGLPYVLGQKVIDNTFHCLICNAVIYGKVDFKDHCVISHDTEEKDVVYSLEFDWVHLKIGYGHYEMNMVRSFFELNWDVMVKDLAFCMGFCTENAQKYAKKGSDHHKSWELFNILYEGSLDELLVPYVRKCIQAKISPTPKGYLEWTTQVNSPKYQFMQEQILTYAQAILNFRRGVRYNDKDLIMSGKFKHAPVFHGRNHPKYQQIELTEARNDLSMPPEVKTFVHSHQSISQSGMPGRGEDIDFVLENINKRSKVWTPKGVPAESDWLRTFRNLDKLDMMRTHTLTRMGCEDPKSAVSASSSHAPRVEEVQAWREVLRESKFLENPNHECLMESVSGAPLDDQLVNFTDNAWSRRRCLYKVMFEGTGSGNVPDPIFVLPQERISFHDIKNQTKEVISGKIRELIETFPDGNVKYDYLEEWSCVEKKRKEDYVHFYEKIIEELEASNV